MNTTKIEMPDRLITVEGGYAKDIAKMIMDLSGSGPSFNTTASPSGQATPAINEEPLPMPALNWDSVAHVSGPTAAELAKVATAEPHADPIPRVANYSGMGPVPGDNEAPLEMPAMNFAKPAAESYTVPLTGKPALPVGEQPMPLPVFR